jgi:LmbE family N-acetylglucosaminyl deacetylase
MAKTVGVALIVKNEEALLERCLESVKEADNIYILDTGSVDRTVEIARKYTDNVFLHYTWTDSFCDAQNEIKKFVKEDFILSIDADEYLDVPFSEVRKAIELAKDTVRVQMVAQGSHKLDFGFSRLFRNSPDIYWVQPIHKHLNIPGEGEPVGNVRIVFGWSPAHNLDPDRTLRILEKTVAEEKEPGRNLYYLGREYYYKHRYKEATETLGRYVQISVWAAEKAEAFLTMSKAYSSQGLDEDARDACLQAIKLNSDFKEAIQWMADISTPENAQQWKRMTKTANSRGVMWNRVDAQPIRDIIFLAPHNDDESLFAAYTLMRVKPLVIIITDSYIQPGRGDSGCSMEERRKETIDAMNLIGCPVLFMGIPDTELTKDVLCERLKGFDPETVYVPALQGGNPQHDLINKVALELFGKDKCEQYCTYTKTELYTTGGWEVAPTQQEIELKNKMLDCYQSQINLPSTAPHFEAVRNRSEWLM